MLFFRHCDGLENRCNRPESFFAGDFGKSGIHVRPFVVFTGGGGFQVVQGRCDHARGKGGRNFDFAPLQELEQPFGVLFFLVGGFGENVGDLDKASFLACLAK